MSLDKVSAKQSPEGVLNTVVGISRGGGVATAGRPIAEVEVAPQEDSFVLLGTYKDKEQPKGFCVEFEPDTEAAELVTVEVTTRDVAGGFQYLLEIVNGSNKTIGVGVRAL